MTSTHSSPEAMPGIQPNRAPAAKAGSAAAVLATLRLSLRKNSVVAVTALILMMVTLPLILILMATADPTIANNVSSALPELFMGLTSFLTLTISLFGLVLSAGLMFGFLHNRPALDVIHALPVRRLPFYTGRFLAGYLLVAGPQLLTFLTVLALRFTPYLQSISTSQIIKTALQTALMSLAVYAASVLAFLLTGTIFDALFLILLLNAAYPATLLTIDYFASLVLPGYNMGNLANLDRYLLLTPIGQFYTAVIQPLDWIQVLWWAFLVIVMAGGAWLLYRRRPSELAGKPFAYRTPFLVIRFLASVVVGLFFGYLFHRFQPGLLPYGCGVLIGSFTIHLVIEVILSRGFGAFRRSLPSYGVFIVLFGIGCAVVATGFFGYDDRLPNPDQIVSVELTTNELGSIYQSNGRVVYPTFQEAQNVLLIRALHESYLQTLHTAVSKPYTLSTAEKLQSLAYGNQAETASGDIRSPEEVSYDTGAAVCRISYHLASGRQLTRTYTIIFSQEPFAGLISKLKSTAEYNLQKYAVFFQPAARIPNLSLTEKTGQPVFTLTNPQDLAEMERLQDALRADLTQGAAENTDAQFIGDLAVSDGAYQTIRLNNGYAATLTVLTELKLINNLAAISDRFEVAYIARDPRQFDLRMEMQKMSGDSAYGYTPQYYPDAGPQSPRLNSSADFLTVRDPAVIKAFYQAGNRDWPAAEDGYLVLLAVRGQVQDDGLTNGPLPALYVPASALPADLLSQLK